MLKTIELIKNTNFILIMNYKILLFYLLICLSSQQIRATISDACKQGLECSFNEKSEIRLNELLREQRKDKETERGQHDNYDFNYHVEATHYDEPKDNPLSEKDHTNLPDSSKIGSKDSSAQFGAVGASHFRNTVNHYHGADLAANFRRGRQIDAERAEQVRLDIERKYAEASILDPDLILLREKAHRLKKSSEYYVNQKEKLKTLQNELSDEQPYYKPRKKLVETATEVLKTSKTYFLNHEFDEFDITTSFADALLDLATAFTPGISWGRDVYEAIAGLDLITGEELETFGRSMAILGSVTCGLGSKVGKGFKVVGKLLKGGGKAEEALKRGTKIHKATQNFKVAEKKIKDFAIDLTNPKRRNHILYGDATGGGHLYPGQPGKNAFPQNWSGNKILYETSDIITDPKVNWKQIKGPEGQEYTRSGQPSRWEAIAVRDDIEIKVIIEPAGEGIISSFPIKGPGVIRNL